MDKLDCTVNTKEKISRLSVEQVLEALGTGNGGTAENAAFVYARNPGW